MLNSVSTEKLKEHHKNGYYFTDIEGEKYEEVRRSIEQYGIRDPIKITTDYTVISGHQRLRIARDIGLDRVPVEMVPDLNEQEVEYLLIAENVERRGQAETDPIKKSRIANFLKEYWGVKQGVRSDLVNNSLSSKDIADAIGETVDNTKRIMKLNDLIPELQELVSKGKLGQTAGGQLAHMTEDNQKALLSVLGDEIERTTVAKAKDYRSAEKDSVDANEYEEKIQVLQKQVEMERKERERLEQQEPKVIEKEVIKEIDNTDYVKMKKLQRQHDNMERDYNLMKQKLKLHREDAEAYTKLKEDMERLHTEKDDVHRQIESATSISKLVVDIEYLLSNKLAPLEYSRAMNEQMDSQVVLDNVWDILDRVENWHRKMVGIMPDRNERRTVDAVDAGIVEVYDLEIIDQ